MHIRLFKPDDIPTLSDLCHEYYEKEFSPTEVLNDKTIQLYTVTDDDKTVAIGSIQMLVELDIVMNKSLSTRDRREASYKILHAAMFTASNLGFKQIHAFVQDENFIKHLMKINFRQTKGKGLILSL